MKIRLTEPGWETYTGQMGITNYENGLSTTEVKLRDAYRMAAVFRCEWEDGTSPSVTQGMLDTAGEEAPMQPFHELSESELAAMNEADRLDRIAAAARVEAAEQAARQDTTNDIMKVENDLAAETPSKKADPEITVDTRFTVSELEKIADDKGIAGLRAVADLHNVSGRKISDIIDDLVARGIATNDKA